MDEQDFRLATLVIQLRCTANYSDNNILVYCFHNVILCSAATVNIPQHFSVTLNSELILISCVHKPCWKQT